MDVQNIKTFVKVAELKSFTKAAAEMNYVQSTATMQVRQLEKELGYPLFDRIGKRVSLTEYGAEFLGYAYEMLHAVERAERIGDADREIGGALRIGISESLLFSSLAPLLPQFKSDYPQLRLSVKTGHMLDLVEQIKQNQLDMIYVAANHNVDPDLVSYYKREESLAFLCAATHPLVSQHDIPIDELMTYEFLVTEHEGICQGRLRELAAQHNQTLCAPIEIDSAHVIARLVRRGVGLAFLPRHFVEKELEDGTLVALDVNVEMPRYYSQILCHKNRYVSPIMCRLIEAIKFARPEG